MKFKRLKLKNFCSFEDAEVNLESRGPLLVEGKNTDAGGSNGAGKSSIFNGLCWALYGKTPVNLKGDDVVREGSKGESSVALHLEHLREDLVVTRSRKPKSGLHVVYAGEEVTASTAKALQEKLETLLGVSYQVFTQVVVFPQAKLGLGALTDSEVKSLLDTVLDMDRFATAQEKAKEQLKQLKYEYQKAYEVVGQLELQRDAAKEKHILNKNRADAWEDQQKSKIRKLEEKLKSLDEQELQEKIDNLYEEAEKYSEYFHELTEEESLLAANYYKLSQRIISIEQEIKFIDERIQAAKARPVEEVEGDCPTCGQSLPGHIMEAVLRKQQKKREEIAQEVADLENSKLLQQEDLGEFHERYQLAKAAHEKYAQQAKVTEAVNKLVSEMDKLSVQQESQDELYSHLQKEIEEIKQDENIYYKIASDYADKAISLHNELTKQKKVVDDLKQVVEDYEFWVQGFGNKGVKNLFLRQITPYLNQQANKYFSFLTGGQGSVEIQTTKKLKSGEERDQFSVKVNIPGTKSNYANLSGGEKRRVDLALMFAVFDLFRLQSRVKPSIMLLDEAVESMDEEGAEALVSLLTAFYKDQVETILFISHHGGFKSLFSNVLTVEKVNGISRLR